MVKRWRPTRSAISVIRQASRQVAECGRPEIRVAVRYGELARRDGPEEDPNHRTMDLNMLIPGHDLHDSWELSYLVRGSLVGKITARPRVELWVYDEVELKDQLIVQFDQAGDVVWIRTTTEDGTIIHGSD